MGTPAQAINSLVHSPVQVDTAATGAEMNKKRKRKFNFQQKVEAKFCQKLQ